MYNVYTVYIYIIYKYNSMNIILYTVCIQYNIWQLLDEVEHDSENYQGRGLCYLPKLKAEAK